jgi:nucleotide-binding universal stress UspA family protein
VAVTLAKDHEARLTGIYVVTHAAYSSQGVNAKQDEEEAQALFASKTGGTGIRAEWLAADGGTVGVGMAEVLNYYAHTKDIIIVSQADPGRLQGDTPSDLAQRVVVGAGRPVLVVPYTGTFNSVGKRPIVAWKAGRVSARAVNDALPFLLNAEKVCVLSIKDPAERETESHGDLSSNLESHAIKVKNITIVIKTIPVANLLMDFAWEHSRDLIVMGVYVKYSRGKYDLGPVAKDFFDHMTLPVLMSH